MRSMPDTPGPGSLYSVCPCCVSSRMPPALIVYAISKAYLEMEPQSRVHVASSWTLMFRLVYPPTTQSVLTFTFDELG